MRKVLSVNIASVIMLFFLDAPLAWAESIEGKVRNVDEARRVVTLEDGTKLAIPDNVRVNRKNLEPGARLKASYEHQEGEKLVTEIEVQPADANR